MLDPELRLAPSVVVFKKKLLSIVTEKRLLNR